MVLQSIRERLTGILAFFILGILVIPFAFVGVNSYFTSGDGNIVARVNDAEISATQFNQSFTTYRRRMQSIMGAAFDPLMFDSLVARREHLETMIDEEVLNQVAISAGLELDDARLASQIRQIPAFQVDGEFNIDVYQARLSSQGMTPKQFEREMRAQSVISQLPRGVLNSSMSTRSELADYISLQEQTRTFRSVQVPALEENITVDASEDELRSWYDENPSDFQSEEMVVIEYLELSTWDIPQGVEPDEEFLRTRFEQQKGRFITPEQRQASHILIEVAPDADEATKETARQSAEDLAARARGGESFADLAAEFSQDVGSASNGGDLGWIEPGFMSEAFETALYELTLESPVSDAVQTGFGWHVIELRDVRPATGMSYEEARQTLIDEHQAEEAEREFIEMADRMVDLIYEDPTTLSSAALDLGLDVKTAGPFSRNGGEGLAANPDVVAESFSDLVLLQGTVSDPVEIGENHIIMIRLKEHLPVQVLPFDEVRENIAALLKARAASAAAEAQANEMLAALDVEGATLDSVAENAGFELTVTENAKRRSASPDAVTVQEVFRLGSPSEGEVLHAVVKAANGYALVELQSVTAGSLGEAAAFLEQQFSRQIANAAASAEANGLLEQLRAEAVIEIFEDRLQ